MPGFIRTPLGVGGWKGPEQSLLSAHGNQRYWHLDFRLSGRWMLSFMSPTGQHSITVALQNQYATTSLQNCERHAETTLLTTSSLSTQSLENACWRRKDLPLSTEKEQGTIPPPTLWRLKSLQDRHCTSVLSNNQIPTLRLRCSSVLSRVKEFKVNCTIISSYYRQFSITVVLWKYFTIRVPDR